MLVAVQGSGYKRARVPRCCCSPGYNSEALFPRGVMAGRATSLCLYAHIRQYTISRVRELEQLVKGLADGTRLRILNLLLQGELCVCDIQYVLESSQPNVSRHLTYLKNSGLVIDRREGQRMYYKLVQPAEPSRRQLFVFLRAAFAESEDFSHDSHKLKNAIKSGACTVSEWRPFSGLSKSKPSRVGRL